jgi:hypothetical protein
MYHNARTYTDIGNAGGRWENRKDKYNSGEERAKNRNYKHTKNTQNTQNTKSQKQRRDGGNGQRGTAAAQRA